MMARATQAFLASLQKQAPSPFARLFRRLAIGSPLHESAFGPARACFAWFTAAPVLAHIMHRALI
jgi:hypothetical protein